MKLKPLPQWVTAKERAGYIAKASRYNNWLKDIGRLKKALLVDHLPENIPRVMARDAMDVAYKIPNKLNFVDETALDAKYSVPEEPIPVPANDTTAPPSNNVGNRKRGFATSILVAVAAVFAFSFLFSRSDTSTITREAGAVELDHNHSESEPSSEQPVLTSAPAKLNSEIKALADSEGYFEKDGKLYLRIGESTVWDKLWRGPFKFYSSWDETLQRILDYNPGKRLDRLSPAAELIVINDLNGVNYLVVLENSLRR